MAPGLFTPNPQTRHGGSTETSIFISSLLVNADTILRPGDFTSWMQST